MVQKISVRHPDTVRRQLCLTETCLVERDPATYNAVTAKPLCDVRSTYLSFLLTSIFTVKWTVTHCEMGELFTLRIKY